MTTMDCEKTLQALKRMKVETGSLLCAGCGHEHDCGIRGCAILRNAVEHMEVLLAHYDHLNKLLDDQEEELRRYQGAFNENALLKLTAQAFGLTPEQLQEALQSFRIKEEKGGGY